MAGGAKDFLSIDELSERTGLGVSTLRRLARTGRIPVYQPGGKGGKLLFPPDAIERAGQASESPTDDANDRNSKSLPGRRPNWLKS